MNIFLLLQNLHRSSLIYEDLMLIYDLYFMFISEIVIIKMTKELRRRSNISYAEKGDVSENDENGDDASEADIEDFDL